MLSTMNILNIHDHHRGYDEIPQHPLDRLEPLRNSETRRRTTFDTWPRDASIGCNDLIKDGFYYLGVSDKVQCAYCGGVLSGWESGDSVHDQHKRHFGNCEKVRDDIVSSDDENDLETDGIGYFDESDKQDYAPQDSHVHQPHDFGCLNEQKDLVEKSTPVPTVYNPKFSLYNKRLESYVNWPSDHHLKPDELATAGLYYKDSGDKCQCFLCGGILEEWDEGDIAKAEHKKWFPKCYNSIEYE
ncbi:baculoviral IAP repeat-containing protein 7-A-like [Mytilus trossulus]|uniref:baculoviral IAP repeat-containing protein 7-A-like n=1 Tax=Mytilus trossulus TaxID=6551 RepID=UPI003005DFD1